MSNIVDKLTPTHFFPFRLVIEVAPDAALTVDSIALHSDMKILNIDGKVLDYDNPTPQATPAQLALFLLWLQTNIDTYQTITGLERYVKE